MLFDDAVSVFDLRGRDWSLDYSFNDLVAINRDLDLFLDDLFNDAVSVLNLRLRYFSDNSPFTVFNHTSWWSDNSSSSLYVYLSCDELVKFCIVELAVLIIVIASKNRFSFKSCDAVAMALKVSSPVVHACATADAYSVVSRVDSEGFATLNYLAKLVQLNLVVDLSDQKSGNLVFTISAETTILTLDVLTSRW